VPEWLLIFTLLVLGTTSSLVATRQAMISELVEAANALMATDQSFDPPPPMNCESSTAGSSARDLVNSIVVGSVAPSRVILTQAPCD
jgi:hypothetical protein